MKRLFPIIAAIAFTTIACSGTNGNRNEPGIRSNINQSTSNSNQSTNANQASAAQSPAPGRGTDEITIGGGKVAVEYGRPALQGRNLETMISPGQEWRLGANDPTTLTTDVGLKFGDKVIAPGRYVLRAKLVEPQKWVLLFMQNDAAVAEVSMTFEKVNDAADLMTIDLQEKDNKGRLIIHWGNLVLSSDFEKA